MSKRKSNYQNVRESKRDRFSKPAKRRHSSVPVFVGAAILVGVAILIWSLSTPKPAQTADGGPDDSVGGGGGTSGKTINAGAILLSAQDGIVRLPLATFDDNKAHFYAYQTDRVPVEFFVLKSSDGVVRAAFNACDACFGEHKGYRQEGDQMVCNNCGQRFPSVKINEVRGGCNPAPLDRTVEGDELVIRVDDIVAGTGYFN